MREQLEQNLLAAAAALMAHMGAATGSWTINPTRLRRWAGTTVQS